MKSRRISLFALALAAGIWGPGQSKAQQPGAAKPKPEMGAMILMADGKRQRGFVQDSNDKGLLFTLVEGAPGTGYAWDTQVKAVAFDETDEIMREARAAYQQGLFEVAEKLLGNVADTYYNVAWVPNSFAAEARYYQIEALRQLGRWKEIGPLLETPTAKAIPTRLPEFFQAQFKMDQLWAQFGADQMDAIKAAVEAVQLPVVGQAKLLPSPSFKEMPLRDLVQYTFFRARVNETAGNLDQALADYYRTFSLTFGNQKLLRDLSMKAALSIQARNPALQKEGGASPTVLRQIQSLAYLYKNSFGGGEIEEAFSAFAVKPELPKPPAPKKTEEEAKPADGAAPAVAAPAADGKKEEPAKGAEPPAKGKGKDEAPAAKAKGK